MFMQWILLLLFDIGYIIGWIQKHDKQGSFNGIIKSEKRYVGSVCMIACICLILGIKCEPQKYTAVISMSTFLDPQLTTYSTEYWNMVQILDGEAKEVEINDFSYIPKYFDVPLRHEGLKLFYDKDEVKVIGVEK